MKEIILDGTILADAEKVHPYLKEALKLPEYYGINSDALYDCLTELRNIHITITPPSGDRAVFQKIIRVFKAAARENESIELVIKEPGI